MILSAVCYALGYLTGLVAFVGMARRRGIHTTGVMEVMGAGLIGGLVAANVSQWVAVQAPGKTVLGGLAGGYLTVILYKRRLGLVRPTGDLFAVALSAGEAVGRWGCFFGGCCYGRVARVPWAVWQHGAWRYPTQIFSSVAALAILIILLLWERARPPENALFFLQGLLYCVARFWIEFYRQNQALALGLSAAQWACVAGAPFFAWKLHALLRGKQVVYAPVS